MSIVEHFKKFVPVEHYQLKVDAAHTTKNAFKATKAFRQQQKIPIDTHLDPHSTGLIGERLTDITSDNGDIATKQITTNPNIVAIFINWMEQLNLQKGDIVAVGATGSFPALDISMLAAIKTMGLQPLIIYSSSASQYGANIPNFTFIDIQHYLHQKGIFDYRPIAVSLGGAQDRNHNMSKKGISILTKTINKYNYPFLQPTGTIDSINQRMSLYELAAKDKVISAYINIGGGMASIGLKRVQDKAIKGTDNIHSLPTGVITQFPINLANTDSVAVRFLKRGVPVINIHNIGSKLRNQYGLTTNAQYSIIGWGPLFFHEAYNEFLTAIVLGVVIGVLIMMAVLSRKYRIRYIPPR
jgi:poly-gamma-glutamate system protein